jgi:hypothetical protein
MQELIGALVSHVGCGVSNQATAALICLKSLVDSESQRVVPYFGIVKGVLNYLEPLTVNELRILFDIFATLAFCVRRLVAI